MSAKPGACNSKVFAPAFHSSLPAKAQDVRHSLTQGGPSCRRVRICQLNSNSSLPTLCGGRAPLSTHPWPPMGHSRNTEVSALLCPKFLGSRPSLLWGEGGGEWRPEPFTCLSVTTVPLWAPHPKPKQSPAVSSMQVASALNSQAATGGPPFPL